VKGFSSSNFTRLFAYVPLYFLSNGQKLLVTLIVPSKFTLIWCCVCRSVCHSNSPNIITPALFINALSSEREKMHSHFGKAYTPTLVIHLKFYGVGTKIKKLNDKVHFQQLFQRKTFRMIKAMLVYLYHHHHR